MISNCLRLESNLKKVIFETDLILFLFINFFQYFFLLWSLFLNNFFQLKEPVEFYIPTRIEFVPVLYNTTVFSQGLWLNYTEDGTSEKMFIKSILRTVAEENCILKPNEVCVELNVSEGNYLVNVLNKIFNLLF